MAVADGAGSAPFSREGSRIACETAVDYCKEQLLDSKKFEEEIDTYDQFKEYSESEARKMVGDYIYKIVGTAAFRAQKQFMLRLLHKINQQRFMLRLYC